jgi:hypothetical protein
VLAEGEVRSADMGGKSKTRAMGDEMKRDILG